MIRMATLWLVFILGLPALTAQTEVEVHLQQPTAVAAESDAFMTAAIFGQKYYERGEYAQALAQFEKADAIVPDHPGILYNIALILVRSGRYAEAQTKIDRYLQLYPAGEELPLIKTLQVDLAFERELQRARQRNQNYIELFNRGRFHFERGELDEALARFREAESQKPDDPAVVYNQAVVLEAKGEFARATERLRQFLALSADSASKAEIDQKIFALEREMTDMREKIVCPFCGHKLAGDALWCPVCWHGPYRVASPVWQSRVCRAGTTVTRTTLYTGGRVHQNEDLECLIEGESYESALRYSRAKQRAIRDRRRSEGWTYDGDRLATYKDEGGRQARLVHGRSLEALLAAKSGEVLRFEGRRTSDDAGLLESEEMILDGERNVIRYEYDDRGRIRAVDVVAHASSSCGHLQKTRAEISYVDDRMSTVALSGGYTGFEQEGTPEVEWTGTITYDYDGRGRLLSEELTIDKYEKTYRERPEEPWRSDLKTLYPAMRTRRSLDIRSVGDRCSLLGSRIIGNKIDLRPLYAVSPNLDVLLPFGVDRVSVKVARTD